MSDYYTNDMGSLFIQLGGPNSATAWLQCVDMGDVTAPKGDVTREYCPDPAAKGRWSISTRSQGAPGEVTFDLTIPVGKVSHLLEDAARVGCPVPVYLLQSECGRRDAFLPLGADEVYRGSVYAQARITNEGHSGLAARNMDGSAPVGATATFSLSCEDAVDFFNLITTRRTTTADQILRDIAFCDRAECAGACGPEVEICTHGTAVGDSDGAGGVAMIEFTSDGGATWTTTASDPFAINLAAGAVVCFAMDADTTRKVVFRGQTLAGNPAHCSTCDDLLGTTWSAVIAIGSTNTEWVNGAYAADRWNIWCVTDTGGGAAGNIFYSADAGATWTLQQLCTDAMNAVRFAAGITRVGLVVGDSNDMYLTLDGGTHWNALTGPAAQAAANCISCEILDANRFLVGYDDGELWYTMDGGDTWTERAITNPPAATALLTVDDIYAVDQFCLFIAGSCTIGGNNFGFVERSIDGGANWEVWIPPILTASDGLTALWPCSYNHAVAVGGVATTSMILDVNMS